MGKGNPGRISWKDIGVINLARNPSLHERNVFMCRNFNRLLVRVEPGK